MGTKRYLQHLSSGKANFDPVYIQSRMSLQVISMRKQVESLFYLLLICFIGLPAGSQPLPLEAFHFGEIKLPNHLQNETRLENLCSGEDGRMYLSNGRYLFVKKGNQLEPIAGQGLGGIPGGVNLVFRDGAGRIWAESKQIMYLLNSQTYQFEPHKIIANGDTLKPGFLKVASWGNNLLIVSPDTMIYIYDPDKRQCKALQFKVSIQPPIRIIGLGGNDAVISCGSQIFLLNKQSIVKQVASFHAGTEVLSATLLNNEWLYLWCRQPTLYRIHLPSGNYKSYSIGTAVGRPLGKILVNGKLYALLGGTDSLYFFEPKSDTRFSWHSSERQVGAKFYPRTNAPVQDSYGRVWMPNGQSLFWFDVPETGFNAAFTHMDKLAGLPIGDFLEPKQISVSRYNPIVLYTTGKILHIYDSVLQKIVQQAILPVDKDFSIIGLTELNKNEWLINAVQGLFRFNLTTNAFTQITYAGEPLKLTKCQVIGDTIIIRDRNYKIYKCPAFSPDKIILTTNSPETVHDLLKGEKQELYAITNKGLMLQKNPSAIWTLLTPLKDFDNVYSGMLKIAFHHSRKQLIIFGNGKLWIISPKDGKVISSLLLNKPGLPYAVNQINILDHNNIVLVQNNQPLTILNLSSLTFYPIGIKQGWWGQYMGAQTHISTGYKNDWWATVDAGLVHFTTNQLLEKPIPPPAPEIHQIQIQYANHPFPAVRYYNNPLEVSYQKGTVSFMLSGIESDSIEYCLPPYDDHWRRGVAATFTNLPGGLYTLKVREAGAAGLFSPETTLLLRILPPFWKTLWFRVLASIILAGVAYLLFRMRLNQQNRKNLQQLQVAQSELKAIRSQMNPHFIFNCVTAIDALIATGQSQKASAYLAKFSKLVRQVLQLSEKQLISLEDEINTLKLYLQLEQLRMQDSFDFSFKIGEGLEEQVEIPPMLLQPFVENAIIHGLKASMKDKKLIRISCEKGGNKVFFTIEDNGVGRKTADINKSSIKHHTSMGIKLTGDRLKMMEMVLPIKTNYFYTDLFDEKGTPAGTKVTIEITYQNGDK